MDIKADLYTSNAVVRVLGCFYTNTICGGTPPGTPTTISITQFCQHGKVQKASDQGPLSQTGK